MALTKQYLTAVRAWLTLSGIKNGDMVKLMCVPGTNYGNEEYYFDDSECDNIKDWIGHTFAVELICSDLSLLITDEDQDINFNVPVWCVIKESGTRIKLNDEYDAVLSADGTSLKVGCQTIPAAAVVKLAAAIAANKTTTKKPVVKKAMKKIAKKRIR